MENPFHFGRELTTRELVDREDELSEIVGTVLARGRLFLIGPRRFGKTSVLVAAQARAEERGAIVLRVNAQEFPSLEALTARLVTLAADRLVPLGKKMASSLAAVFRALRPRIAMEADGSLSVGLDPSAPPGPQGIAEALHGIHALAEKRKAPVALMFDEFQEIVAGDPKAEGMLRSAIQAHPKLGYVFAGSDTRFLTELTSDPARPFFQSGARLFLGPIPREEFRKFLLAGLHRRSRAITPDVPDLILDLAEDVPYNVQRLAYAVWDAAGPELDGSQVRAALATWIRRDDPFYTHLWNALSTNQKAAAAEVARRAGSDFYSRDALASARLTASGMRAAIDGLVVKQVLRKVPQEADLLARFEDPFFGHWIRQIVLES